MSLKDIIGNEEIIFVGPRELKDYFFDERKHDPFLNFKYFTLDELIKNLKGNYLDKNVIKLGYQFFPEYTYSLIKEVSKFVYYSLDISKCENEKIVEFCRVLEKNQYLKFNEDFLNLLKNRKIIFINLKESSYIKNFIKTFSLINFEYREIDEIVEENTNLNYYEFFNIGEEIRYAFNKVLNEIFLNKKPNEFMMILDLDRYDYYLNLFSSNLDIPINFKTIKTLKDTEIYKDIYSKIEDDFSVVNYLDTNKGKYNEEEFNLVKDTLSFYEIDSLKNKRLNFKEIMSSIRLDKDVYSNGLDFSSSIYFSKSKKIYVLGLDNTFLPKVIKDNNLFSYDYLVKNGFDSLDETNTMKNKLEMSFLKQKNINFVSFHFKDNSGKYSLSYYLTSLPFKKLNSEELKNEYIKDVSYLYYRNKFDDYERTGIISEELKNYKATFGNAFISNFNPNFTRLTSYEFNETKPFSYSSLKEFHECPFNYFCDNILNVSKNEDSIYQKYGTLAHAILEDVYLPNFDFEKSLTKAIEKLNYFGKKIDEKEQILLNRFLFEIKQAINYIILPHKNDMSFLTSYSEKNLEVNVKVPALSFSYKDNVLASDEVAYNTKFKGKIDSIIETNESNLFVIDYKTGSDTFSKKNVFDYQLDLQLPTYIYLIEKSNDKDLVNKPVQGVFLEKIVANQGRFYNFYSPTQDDLDTLRYDGAFIDDLNAMLTFDHALNDKNVKSKYVVGLETNSNGKKLSKKGSGRTKALTFTEFNSMRDVVEANYIESVKKIANGSFHIEPFKKGKIYIGCQFCKNFDICFKRNKQMEDE